MSDKPQSNSAQFNLALEQRVAGRDYHEYFVSGSIKQWVTTTTKNKLDEVSTSNEKLFRYRFGFKATSTVCHQVIAFQNKYDLLDDEIRWLKRAGHLRVTRQKLIIDTSRLMPMYGLFQVVLVSVVCTAVIQLLANLDTATWKRDLFQLGLVATWLCVVAMMIKMFVNPWRTLQKAGALNAHP